jgi:hypothetical protein
MTSPGIEPQTSRSLVQYYIRGVAVLRLQCCAEACTGTLWDGAGRAGSRRERRAQETTPTSSIALCIGEGSSLSLSRSLSFSLSISISFSLALSLSLYLSLFLFISLAFMYFFLIPNHSFCFCLLVLYVSFLDLFSNSISTVASTTVLSALKKRKNDLFEQNCTK